MSLRQNPDLLRYAARTGETVRIEITAAEQGAVVQEDVTAVLDCGPWLANFPGGTVRWYKYRYTDLDHTFLSTFRSLQVPEFLNSVAIGRATISGDFNEKYTIIRGIISPDAEDSSRGVYECEVWVGVDVCSSANTTILNVGRPPIIDSGAGTG